MKISKQERIIIVCLLVAAILGVGIFLFILPNYNNIGANNKTLAAAKEEYQELQTKLEHEATIDDEIKAAYEEGKDLANTFYDDLTTYEADEIMRQFIAKGKDITVDGLSISPMSTETLSISVFMPTEVTYPLKDFANTVVTQDEEAVDIESMTPRELVIYAKKLVSTMLALSEPVTVGCTSVSFTASSDKLENLHAFADLLNAGVYDEKIVGADGKPQRKATYVNGVTFELSDKSSTQTTSGDKEGTEANQDDQQSSSSSGSGKYSMSFNVKLYSIKPVADPFEQAE